MLILQVVSKDRHSFNFNLCPEKIIPIILDSNFLINDIFGIIKLLRILSFRILIHFGLSLLFKALFNINKINLIIRRLTLCLYLEEDMLWLEPDLFLVE